MASMFIPDVSVALGILGLVAVILSSMELLSLFMVLVPASVLLDLIKLGIVARPKAFGYVGGGLGLGLGLG